MSVLTQDDFDDGGFTTYNEGFVAYMFGEHLHQNPYKAYSDVEVDQHEYYEWFDGWIAAQRRYPNISRKSDDEDNWQTEAT